jgi:DHA1 family tetracycline resistance protein-like MFS transporter
MSATEPTDRSTEPRVGANRKIMAIVFATILIDFIGYSVLIPVLPLYAERLGASPVEVGLILTLYALAQLLFLPAWGWVSDRVGRRPVILVSLLGTAISFVMLAYSDTLTMVYLARILAGFFAASIGTAQAVVTDVTPPSERTRGMGVIGAAFGVGMILGPMLGGSLAAVDERLPFFAIAALALANFFLAVFSLPESRPAGLPKRPWREFATSLVPTPLRLVSAVHDRRIGLYLYLFFHLFTAFAILEAMGTLYLGHRYDADELQIAIIFAWIGLFLAVTQGVLLRRLVVSFGEVKLVVAGLLLMAMGLAAVAVAPHFEWFYAIGVVIAVGNGLTFPSFTSLFSKSCDPEQAGELMAQSQSMATAGRIVAPVGAGWAMESWSLAAPFWIASLMMIAALAFFLGARKTLVEG